MSEQNQGLAKPTDESAIERVVMGGDLSRLDAAGRMSYYQAVCRSIGVNPLTRPFDYITLNGKLTLYAKKDATDQLRKINGVSIEKLEITFQDNLIIVNVTGTDKTGRTDSEVGVVNKTDMRGDMANALMKAVTKAKRRLTLSICGLGFLDETEVETVPDAKPAEIAPPEPEPGPPKAHWIDDARTRATFWGWVRDNRGLSDEQVYEALGVSNLHEFAGTAKAACEQIAARYPKQAATGGTDEEPPA